MAEWQIEMLWRCSTCKAENKGRFKKCESCGAPKKDSDEFYMPDDTSFEARVTDEKQILDAKAGADWKCKFCSSAQKKLDGTCAECGASQDEAAVSQPPRTTIPDSPQARAVSMPPRIDTDPPPSVRTPVPIFRSKRPYFVAAAILGALLVLFYFLFRTRELDATVSGVTWKHTIHIDRYAVTRDDGFHPPGDAFNVQREGERIDHYDHRWVGSHQESYQASERCGETCTPIPKSCTKSCTNNKNGYATCRDVCTGGGQSCSPKYCTVTKIRRVDDYQDFPVYEPYYSWNVWRWRHERDVQASGSTTQTSWPDETPPVPLRDREQERGTREASYTVTFTKGKDTWAYHPRDLDAFRALPPGTRRHIKVSVAGGVELLP